MFPRPQFDDPPREMSPLEVEGYLKVNLRKHGKQKLHSIHRLVLKAFQGPPEGRQARHLNGDRHNNHIDNLKWGTAAENSDDRDRHGTTARGERQGLTDLTDEQVLEIRRKRYFEQSQRSLAEEYDVGKRTVKRIVCGETWEHVGGPIRGEDYQIERRGNHWITVDIE